MTWRRLVVARGVALALGLLALAACVHRAPSGDDVAATVSAHPDIRIERRDGSTVRLQRASIVGDSVVGMSDGTRVPIALADVARADAPGSTARRGAEGMAILFAPLALVVAALVVATH